MNAFRITLLALLALAVVSLLGVVTIFQSTQEANYEAYLASVKASERQLLMEAHADRMKRIGPQEGETTEADEALAAANREQEKQVTDEEERNVLATAVRKDAEEVEETATEEATAEKPLGLVASYNQEWGFIMVKPVSDEPMPSGMVVAVRRGSNIICEVEIGEEEVDEQSGERLLSATIRESQFTQATDNISADKFAPAVGDEIIISPYMSSRDLRASHAPIAPGDSILPEAHCYPTQPQEGLQEVEATLTPMP